MTGKRPDLARLSPDQKDALIRDLWRQVAAGQSEARLLKRRLGMAEPSGDRSESVLLGKLRDALLGGAASSWMMQNLAPKILDKDADAGFRIDLMLKDLRLTGELAFALGTPCS